VGFGRRFCELAARRHVAPVEHGSAFARSAIGKYFACAGATSKWQLVARQQPFTELTVKDFFWTITS
jgi:predicted HD phosphohydrolase